MPSTYETERTLTREVSQRVESGVPGVEVLAVELISPQRFCVFIDHPQGVDLALCERVTAELRPFLDRYGIDVSSPGFERPLRKREHFERAVGQTVHLKTEREIEGRKKFKGELVEAGERSVKLGLDGDEIHIPYDQIARANLTTESR